MAPERKKAVLIAGAIGLVLVAYLLLSRKGSSAAPAAAGDSSSSGLPQTSSSGAGDSSQSAADLLAAISGQNKDLLRGFLDSSHGLVSLAGSSLGAPLGSQSAGEPAAAAFSFDTPSDAAAFSTDAGTVPADAEPATIFASPTSSPAPSSSLIPGGGPVFFPSPKTIASVAAAPDAAAQATYAANQIAQPDRATPGALDPNVDYTAPEFGSAEAAGSQYSIVSGSNVVPDNPQTGYAYGDVGAL